MEYLHSLTDQKDARYCSYHRRKGHTLEQCVTFRRIFNKKHKAGEILSQKGALSVNDLPFLKYNRKGKGQVMMA